MASMFGVCFRSRQRLLATAAPTPARHSPILLPLSSTRSRNVASNSKQRLARPDTHLGATRLNTALCKPIQSFSTASRRNQQVILNPRKDEEGKEMLVEITPRAANVFIFKLLGLNRLSDLFQRLKEIMKTDSNPDLALRVTVESGGCHGFQYLMSLTDMSKVSQEEDTVFEGSDGAKVVMDEPSLELLKGSKVDYTMELIGSQFKITDNPLATSSCGCGTSFDIKS